MPKRSDEIRRLKRKLTKRLSDLHMSKERAIKLFDKLWTIDYLLNQIADINEKMIAYGDEWQKDDWPHACCAG